MLGALAKSPVEDPRAFFIAEDSEHMNASQCVHTRTSQVTKGLILRGLLRFLSPRLCARCGSKALSCSELRNSHINRFFASFLQIWSAKALQFLTVAVATLKNSIAFSTANLEKILRKSFVT